MLIIVFIALNISANVEYGESQNGLTHPFFGYKKVIEKEDENQTKKTITIPKNLDQLTADQLSKIIKDSKKIAVAFPTDQNIHKYITLQNHATKKSEDFAIKWQQAILKDSSLDLSASAAKSTFARNASTADKAQKRASFWQKYIDKIGVVVFFSKNESSVNQAQNKVLFFLKQDYPELAIRTVFKDEHPKLAKEHGVGVTPDIFIVYKDKEENANWYRVKAGLTTKNQILNNIDFIYQYFITPKEVR
jgi:conjugal transfer pilus assembly protein TraF